MTRAEFRALVEPAVLALGASWDEPTWTAYYRSLRDLPMPWLQAAITIVERRTRQPYEPSFPSAPTIRAYAEQALQAYVAAHPYTGCVECEDSPGFRVRLDLSRTVERCPCRVRYLARLSS